jgi:aryl sulfotransferase
MLMHFNNLKADLPAEMRRIASFLGIEIGEELWPTLVEHCTVDYMRKAAPTNSPLLDVVFQGGANTCFHKGTNGRWRDVLSSAEVRRYEEMALAKLTPGCAHWVATGEMTP